MKYILVFTGLFILSLPVQSQETLGIDNPNNPILENDSKEVTAKQEASQLEEAQLEESRKNKEQTKEQAQASSESDFDVFRPSEDISEDLAVPFPVDI